MPERHLVVDMANVVGSQPDGWWRDRAGAAVRMAARITTALDEGTFGPATVHLVLEGRARTAEIPAHPRVRVIRAPEDGDGAIVELVAELAGDVTVVTADRGLRARLRAPAIGPGTLLSAL